MLPVPNSVIEALASGCPVIGFDSGALKELVPENAGSITPYGGNPWKLDIPDMHFLERSSTKIFKNFTKYSKKAREAAEKKFDLDNMAARYLDILSNL